MSSVNALWSVRVITGYSISSTEVTPTWQREAGKMRQGRQGMLCTAPTRTSTGCRGWPGLCQTDLVCSAHRSYHTRNLRHRDASWHHRILTQSWDWRFRLFCLKHGFISSSVMSRLKFLWVKLYTKIYILRDLVCGCHHISSLVVLQNSIPNKRISAYISFHPHAQVHQMLNTAFQWSLTSFLTSLDSLGSRRALQ